MNLILWLLSSTVVIGNIEGVISPITANYVQRVIDKAEEKEAEAIVFLLDTPGGLMDAMREIVKDELNSNITIIIYVYPSGASDASAGVFLTYAAHIAAMTPGTNLGAAHPVAISPQGIGGGEEKKADDTMMEKATEDAAAYLRGIAKKRNRNIEWAEKAVRESVSATAEEALELGIIDLVVSSVDELLEKIHGRKVELPGGVKKLDTKNAERENLPMNFREEFLKLISNPNIAYILFIVGIYGLIFEIRSPGAIIPGVLGALCIILAFYSFSVLPINYAGVALIILGIAMFVMEVLTPTYGPLTIGGIVSMSIGSIMLINTDATFLQISKPLIFAAVGTTAAFFIFALGAVIKAMKNKPTTGKEGLTGAIGKAVSDINSKGGKVFVRGEYWNAVANKKIKIDTEVEVVEVNGLTVKVKKKEV
ncbi:nodulation protein NfeD [candidate division WOR-3 bacterium]|nr:nodulation protein NfeD [candidate division WOR-3 bacterium]